MTIKKLVYLNTLITFLLCFLTHFIYEWIPNDIVAMFFSVNESIWEHMKMLFTTLLLYGIIEYFLLKKFKIEVNNFLLTIFLKAILIIPIYLIIFMPIYFAIGENFIIAILVMFISIFIVNKLSPVLLDTYEYKYGSDIAIIGIVLTYIIMALLTFNPPKAMIFYDTTAKTYGIVK